MLKETVMHGKFFFFIFFFNEAMNVENIYNFRHHMHPPLSLIGYNIGAMQTVKTL